MERGEHTVPGHLGEGYAPRDVRRALWHITVAWIFGAPFFSIISGAAFTAFLTRYLRADDFTYGLIMAASPAAMLFLFLGSYATERTGRVKRNFLLFVSAQRLLWLAVAAVPLLPHGVSAGARLALVGAIVFVSQAMANFGGAGWWAWVSNLVPTSIAGRYFGLRAQLSIVSMVVVSTAVVYLLQRHGGQGWVYALVFAIAAVLGTIDILLFIPVPEVPLRSELPRPTLRQILVTPWQNPLFRGFALYTAVSWLAYLMMSSFAWRFCFETVERNGLGMSVLQTHLMLAIVPLLLMARMSPVWGHAIDRFGPKPVLTLSALAVAFVPIPWMLAHPGVLWPAWVATVATGLVWPGVEQVNFYMTVKGFPEARRSAYTSALQFVFGLSATVGIALGGVLASFWQTHLHWLAFLPSWLSHYQPVFFTSMLLRLVAFVWLLRRLTLPGSSDYAGVAHAIARDVSSSLSGVKRRS
ncbi:MAG: MFS transporter [Armatimonadota bacterium]|nr:MFS transporter [Armatimonadota bacterium]